jgi:hypothetical protein
LPRQSRKSGGWVLVVELLFHGANTKKKKNKRPARGELSMFFSKKKHDETRFDLALIIIVWSAPDDGN